MNFIYRVKYFVNFMRLQDRNKLKLIAKRFFKIITMLISLCGLIYQAHIIYDQYMSGRTVVNLQIGQIKNELPAITICFEGLFSMERAAKFHSDFVEINKRYLELLKNRSVEEYSKLYKESFRNYTEKHLKDNGLDMNELFDKMSIKFKALDESYTILLSFYGRSDNKTLPAHLIEYPGKNYNTYYYHVEPLETIVIRQFDKNLDSIDETKCLTFFSHVEKEWRTFQAQISTIIIDKSNEVRKSLPYNINYYVSIHSPNNLPDFIIPATFKQIDIRKEISIKYSENRIQRLGKGYDTDCYDYESDNSFGYYRMRSDCINDCYQKKRREICKVDRGLLMSHSLIRKDYLVNGNERLISCYDPEYNYESFFLKQDCEKLCKIECNVRYYTIELDRRNIDPKLTATRIQHSQYPDIFVEHIPGMNLIGFLCNFGGLLGMWLGLSLFGLFNDIFKLITKIAYRKYINLINVKINNANCNCNFVRRHRNVMRWVNK